MLRDKNIATFMLQLCYEQRTPLVAASGVLINFAILEPFSNKVAGLFNRIPMVTPSDFSLQ